MLVKPNNKLSKIFDNKKSGSTDILIELHEHLKKEQKIIQLFPEIIHIAKAQLRSFQNVQIYLDEMKSSLQRDKNLDAFFNKYDTIFLNPFNSLYEKSKKILIKYSSFITISNSRTVFEIFNRLNNDIAKLNVVVCESRPKNEGRLIAKKLAQLNISTQIITEAMIFEAVKKIDAALVGSDCILKNGDIINKVGTFLLASMCRQLKKPFYVIARKDKFSESNKFNQNEMPPEEIWRHNPKNILIKNFYFERIDKKLITKIISD